MTGPKAIVSSRLDSFRLRVSIWSSKPRFLTAFGLYCLAARQAFGFGRPYAPRGLVACHPTAPTAPAAPQTSALVDPEAIVPSRLCSLRLRVTVRSLWTRCISAFGLYYLATRQSLVSADPNDLVTALLVSLKLSRHQLRTTFRLLPTIRSLWPRCL